jgi:hypothetical protein
MLVLAMAMSFPLGTSHSARGSCHCGFMKTSSKRTRDPYTKLNCLGWIWCKTQNLTIIEQIDKNGWSQELLTLSFISQALKEVFQDDSDKIIDDLINLLLFDAMVGNNDRHFFNWGVLRHLKGKHKPYLSPIYDTARGMFWNYTDSSLMSILADEKHLSHHIVKYNNNTKPKIGWEGEKAINHFQLVENIIKNDMCSIPYLKNLFSNDNLNKAISILYTEFNELITPPRKQLIVRNLQYRFETFNHLLGF